MRSELVGDLNDANNNLMRIAFVVEKTELYKGVIAIEVTFNMDDLVALQVELDLILKNM